MLKAKVIRIRCDLDKILKAKDWTLTKLAEKTGINYNQLSNLKQGRNRPDIENALIIAKALGMHVEDLWVIEWTDGADGVA